MKVVLSNNVSVIEDVLSNKNHNFLHYVKNGKSAYNLALTVGNQQLIDIIKKVDNN